MGSFFLTVSEPAFSASTAHRGKKIFLGAAAYWPSPGQVSRDAGGNTSISTPMQGMLSLRGRWSLGLGWGFEPGASFIIPWSRNIDGSQRVYTTLFHADLSLNPPKSDILLRGGLVAKWVYIYGPGGTVVQRNGTSIASFYTPSADSSSIVTGLDAGIGFFFSERLLGIVQAFVWTPASQSKRSTSVAMGLEYGIL